MRVISRLWRKFKYCRKGNHQFSVYTGRCKYCEVPRPQKPALRRVK